MQLNVATRNARLDVIESLNGTSCSLEIRSGAAPATCASAGSGTILATINLPADWMSAAAGGAKAFLGTWSDASSDNTGVAAHFRLYNSQATKDNTTCFGQGTVGTSAAHLIVDNVNFTAGLPFTIQSFTWTEGNP